MECHDHPPIVSVCHLPLECPTLARMQQVTYATTCTVVCKFCGSDKVVKNGVRTGDIQYYKCRNCGRAFAGNNATEGMQYPSEQIAAAVSLFYDGLSIDAIRRQLDSLYHVYPSDSTVYDWTVRYTKLAVDNAKFSNIRVGSVWTADESVLILDQHVKVWFWDIIDSETRFLLASHMSITRGTKDAQILMQKAWERAQKTPRIIYTDKLAAYLDGIELTFGADTKHKQGGPFDVGNNTNLIERFHGTIKARTKVMRGMRNRERARIVMDGWLINYNFFRPHESLKNKTPGEVAQASFAWKDWLDVVRANKPEIHTCAK